MIKEKGNRCTTREERVVKRNRKRIKRKDTWDKKKTEENNFYEVKMAVIKWNSYKLKCFSPWTRNKQYSIDFFRIPCNFVREV
jgi:hypothetical protein